MLMRVLRVHFRFRSPSWISGHVTSGSHVTSSGTGSHVASGNHVTGNPRWRPEPEMDPQNPHEHQVNLHMVGQNGGRKRLSPRWENGLRKRSERLTSGSFWTNFFSFGHRCGWHGANSLSKNQTELVFLTTQNVRTKSPLAQVGLKRCDLVTDERLGVADTSEPGDRARHFFLICAVRHLQAAVQHNVIVRENLMSVKPTSIPLWSFSIILWLDSLKEAVHLRYKRRGQRIWKLSGYRSSPACPTTTWTQSQGGRCPAITRTQSLEGLLTWEFVLPPHELNHWEDSWSEFLSYHPSDSTGGRTLDLPPKELNPWEAHLSTTRVVISLNHSSLPIHWESL